MSSDDDSYVMTSSEEEEDAPISEIESLRLAMEASLQIVKDEPTPDTKTTVPIAISKPMAAAPKPAAPKPTAVEAEFMRLTDQSWATATHYIEMSGMSGKASEEMPEGSGETKNGAAAATAMAAATGNSVQECAAVAIALFYQMDCTPVDPAIAGAPVAAPVTAPVATQNIAIANFSLQEHFDLLFVTPSPEHLIARGFITTHPELFPPECWDTLQAKLMFEKTYINELCFHAQMEAQPPVQLFVKVPAAWEKSSPVDETATIFQVGWAMRAGTAFNIGWTTTTHDLKASASYNAELPYITVGNHVLSTTLNDMATLEKIKCGEGAIDPKRVLALIDRCEGDVKAAVSMFRLDPQPTGYWK